MALRLIQLIRREAGSLVIKLGIMSTVSGVFQGLVLIIVNEAMGTFSEGVMNFRYLLMFIMCIIAYIYTKRYSLSRTEKLVQDIICNFRISIAEKIKNTRLIEFENIGATRIYATLNQNSDIIVEAARSLVDGCSAVVMLTFSCIYIFFLSKTAFVFTLILNIVGISIYLFTQKSTNRNLRDSKEKENEFFFYLSHLLKGFKETKINRKKADDLFENYIKTTSEEANQKKTVAMIQFANNYIFTHTFFYMLIASIVFLLPRLTDIGPDNLIKIMAVTLFLIGPISVLVSSVPSLARADVAVTNLEELENILMKGDDVKDTVQMHRILRKGGFREIRLERVTFSYEDINGTTFVLGPIDLTIRAGEIVFLVGGNGTGKSTLLKVLTGLYYPKSGRILIDNVPIDMSMYAHYRNILSIIFTDFHLFDRLYGMEDVDEEKLYELLELLELEERTMFVDGRFTNTNLSTGQKKRLAMLITYLEYKPVMVFDEVAADQDPVFRKYLYETFFKELKTDGRTIIAATHDDKYFHIADRVIRMEFGKIIDERNESNP